MTFSTPEEIELVMEARTKIMDSIAQDEPYTAISEMDLLLKTLPDTYIKENKLQPLQKKIQNFLTSQNNNRILRLNQRIKMEIETAIEYYDQNIGSDERLHYQQALEKDLLIIQDEIRTALAKIIKNKILGEIEL